MLAVTKIASRRMFLYYAFGIFENFMYFCISFASFQNVLSGFGVLENQKSKKLIT
jgi:hypothetical protein